MTLPERVLTALASKATGFGDFFGGWVEQDVELLERWAVTDESAPVEAGVLVDWLGVRTELRNYAHLEVPPGGGLVVGGVPIPNDGVYGDAIEYVALLTSIELARRRGTRLAMLELGASYAPWAVFAAVVGQRASCDQITVCAVEASESAMERIEAHARLNGVWESPLVDFRVRNAAVSVSNKPMYFPRVDTSTDNGAQASDSPRRVDYRGMPIEHVRVRGVTLRELTSDLDLVDFVHLDLQGGEAALLRDKKSLRCLDEKVAAIMLATHSRAIEGLAVEALAGRGWQLLRERPVRFQQNGSTSDVVGWTLHDGGQFWTNPRFG